MKFYLREKPIKSKDERNFGSSYCTSTDTHFRIRNPELNATLENQEERDNAEQEFEFDRIFNSPSY